MQESFTRTRIAPTPSGYLHLGNVYSFALTAAWAKRTGASLLLRIDDLDRDRADPKYVRDIFDTLHFMEIPWDEGPRDSLEFGEKWSQLHRMSLYLDALEQLKDSGAVFACTCSRSEIARTGSCTCKSKRLPLDTPDAAWRMDTGDHFIVRKRDGFPAYQLTSVIDDLFYGVDLVIRGEDLLPSTQAQQYLAAVLQRDAFRQIHFIHHPLLRGPGGEKLSKSAGSTSIQYLRKAGKTRQEIFGLIESGLGR